MANRRSVLIGMGGLVAAGGAALGTGAFTTVEAQRTVNIQTAGDASAFLALEAADRTDNTNSTEELNSTSSANQNEYVQVNNDGTIQINLDGSSDDDNDDAGTGLNLNAKTTFRNLVTITNNGTQTISSLTLNIVADGSDSADSGTFSFTIDDNNNVATVPNDTEVLGTDSIVSDLTPGTSIDFGLVIDLIDGGDGSGDLPTTSYTLTITAQTADNTNASS